MNPYSKPTSPNASETNLLRQFSSTSSKYVTDSGYQTLNRESPAPNPQYTSGTVDVTVFRGGYSSARPDFASTGGSLDNKPIFSGYSTIQSGANSLSNNIGSGRESRSLSRTMEYGRSPSSGLYKSPRRLEIKENIYDKTNESGEVTVRNVNKENNPGQYTPESSRPQARLYSSDNKNYNLDRLQSIIDAAKARQANANVPRKESFSGSGTNVTEVRTYNNRTTGQSRPRDLSDASRHESKPFQYVQIERSQDQGPKSYLEPPKYVPSATNQYGTTTDSNILRSGYTLGVTPSIPGTNVVNPMSSTYPGGQSAGLSSALSSGRVNIDQKDSSRKNSYDVKLGSSQNENIKTSLYTAARQGEGSTGGKDEERGFSFRESKDPTAKREIRIYDEFYGQQENLPISPFTPEQLQQKIDRIRVESEIAKQVRQDREHVTPQSSNLVHANLKSSVTSQLQAHPDSVRREEREQNSVYEVSSLMSPPIRRQDLDHMYGSGIGSALQSEASISKKTFYSIEKTNTLAIKAFKDTIAGLAASTTPEKQIKDFSDINSPFNDLRRALNRENVQISRIIIETYEGYTDAPQYHPEEHTRPDVIASHTTPIIVTAFEKPKEENRPLQESARKTPHEAPKEAPHTQVQQQGAIGTLSKKVESPSKLLEAPKEAKYEAPKEVKIIETERLPEKEAVMNESSYRAFEQIDPEVKRSSIRESLLHEEVVNKQLVESKKEERRKESESDKSSKQNDFEVINDAQTPDIVQPENSSENYEELVDQSEFQDAVGGGSGIETPLDKKESVDEPRVWTQSQDVKPKEEEKPVKVSPPQEENLVQENKHINVLERVSEAIHHQKENLKQKIENVTEYINKTEQSKEEHLPQERENKPITEKISEVAKEEVENIKQNKLPESIQEHIPEPPKKEEVKAVQEQESERKDVIEHVEERTKNKKETIKEEVKKVTESISGILHKKDKKEKVIGEEIPKSSYREEILDEEEKVGENLLEKVNSEEGKEKEKKSAKGKKDAEGPKKFTKEIGENDKKESGNFVVKAFIGVVVLMLAGLLGWQLIAEEPEE